MGEPGLCSLLCFLQQLLGERTDMTARVLRDPRFPQMLAIPLYSSGRQLPPLSAPSCWSYACIFSASAAHAQGPRG